MADRHRGRGDPLGLSRSQPRHRAFHANGGSGRSRDRAVGLGRRATGRKGGGRCIRAHGGKAHPGARAGTSGRVFLELHGAMVTQSHDDGEGELLRRVRAALGPATPILVSLDLHANVSPQMLAGADFLSSYRTYPHTDWGGAGARCAEWLERVASWKPRPARALRQCPFLVPITAGCTYTEPAGGLYRRLRAVEQQTGVYLSLNMGFSPADIRDVGPSVTAYGETQAAVNVAADALFSALLAAEREFAAHRPLPAAEAVAKAIRISASASRPVQARSQDRSQLRHSLHRRLQQGCADDLYRSASAAL